jgi:threonine/homoserine/homoserine lactone efflux protein
MIKNARVLIYGALISFLGSLPLGTMNITATHIAISDGVKDAMIYSFGSMLVEAIYVSLVLIAMGRLQLGSKYFQFFEWLTLFVLFGLALASLHAAVENLGFGAALPVKIEHPFLTGLSLSAINPLHIIFWLGWSTFLMSKNILISASRSNKWYYILGICIGTMLGFTVYIFAGSFFTKQINANQHAINWTIGLVLMITGLVQGYKIIKTKRLRLI